MTPLYRRNSVAGVTKALMADPLYLVYKGSCEVFPGNLRSICYEAFNMLIELHASLLPLKDFPIYTTRVGFSM